MFGFKLLPEKIYNSLTQAVEWDISMNRPMSETLALEIEAQEATIAALVGEIEELRLQLAHEAFVIEDLKQRLKW